MAERKGSLIVDIKLHGKRKDEKLPTLAMYLIDAAGAPCRKLARVDDGKLKIEEGWRKLGRVVDQMEASVLEAVFGERLSEVPLITTTPNIGESWAEAH